MNLPLKQKRLALSCSGREASLAFDDGTVDLIVRKNTVPRAHAEFIHSALNEILKERSCALRDIDQLIVDLGPGSFTGVRIATSFAKAFGYLRQNPIWTCSSLVIEQPPLEVEDSSLFLTAIDGMNGAFYYWLRTKSTEDEMVFSVGDFEHILTALQSSRFVTIKTIYVLGDGYAKLESLLMAQGFQVIQSVRTRTLAELLLEVATQYPTFFKKNEWKRILPLYLRASAAEEKEG